jgi:hypothetical protein
MPSLISGIRLMEKAWLQVRSKNVLTLAQVVDKILIPYNIHVATCV